MQYVNRQTGQIISQSTYNSLSPSAKSNYVPDSGSSSSSSSNDLLGFGVSVAVGAATNSAIIGGLVGGDIVGGIVGDLLGGGGLFD